MKEQEIKELLKLRQYVIDCHNSLDGSASVSVAVVKQDDVAYEYTQIIKKIDKMLSKYVSFERKN